VTLPLEIYSGRRKGEFLLNNAVDEEDQERALEAVREVGIDPDSIDRTPAS